MLTQNREAPLMIMLGAILIAFISLMSGIMVRGYTLDMLQDTWWVWSAAGAQTGFILTSILLCTWIEDDPCGVIKSVIGATVTGAILFPLFIGIGWVEWRIINLLWPIGH
jgi:hypothetical protein